MFLIQCYNSTVSLGYPPTYKEAFINLSTGAEPDISIWGATGGASFATRGADNGLCRTFRKRPTPPLKG